MKSSGATIWIKPLQQYFSSVLFSDIWKKLELIWIKFFCVWIFFFVIILEPDTRISRICNLLFHAFRSH